MSQQSAERLFSISTASLGDDDVTEWAALQFITQNAMRFCITWNATRLRSVPESPRPASGNNYIKKILIFWHFPKCYNDIFEWVYLNICTTTWNMSQTAKAFVGWRWSRVERLNVKQQFKKCRFEIWRMNGHLIANRYTVARMVPRLTRLCVKPGQRQARCNFTDGRISP